MAAKGSKAKGGKEWGRKARKGEGKALRHRVRNEVHLEAKMRKAGPMEHKTAPRGGERAQAKREVAKARTERPAAQRAYEVASATEFLTKLEQGERDEAPTVSDRAGSAPATSGLRCNRCHRPMLGTTAYDGACACGGLIEAAPSPAPVAPMVDATGYPIRVGQRVYVPARQSRLAPESWDPDEKTGGLPAISGVVVAVREESPSIRATVVIREFDSHATCWILAEHVRVQPDRFGTIEACQFFLRRAVRDGNRAEAYEIEARLAGHIARSKREMKKLGMREVQS